MSTLNHNRYTLSQLWFLSLGAVLFEMNGLDREDYYDLSANNKQDLSRTLKRDWDIANREELESSLQWLMEEGHRTSFDEIRHFLSTLSAAEQMDYIQDISNNKEKHDQYLIVHTYSGQLPEAGIAAWDFGRYVNLCKIGAYLGYISESEQWDLMKKIAVIAQQSYSGWLEYGISYLVGRQFWLNQLSADSTEKQVDYIRGLILDKKSFWNQLDWYIELV